MRLFVAAEIPPEARLRAKEIQAALSDLPLRVRWTRPEGIHLTFKFLGEVAEERLGRIEPALQGACAASRRFRLTARGVGAFPDRGVPRILWLGLQGGVAAAARLWDAIEAAMDRCGFPREARPFHPHLTLGRVVEGPGSGWEAVLTRHRDDTAGEFAVDGCALFRSHLHPSGARYEALQRFALGPETP